MGTPPACRTSRTVEAAEDLDVDAGIDLLCTSLSGQQRRELDGLIAEGREETGSNDPALEGKAFDAVVLAEETDGRSCIAGLEGGDSVGEDAD